MYAQNSQIIIDDITKKKTPNTIILSSEKNTFFFVPISLGYFGQFYLIQIPPPLPFDQWCESYM